MSPRPSEPSSSSRAAAAGERAPARGRVLICDELAPEALEVFAEHGLAAEVRTGLAEAELAERAREVDALVVRSATRVTRAVIEGAPRLAVIGRAGVGVDNIDLDAATEQGVLVVNAPSGNTTATAELAIAHLCALARHLPRADRAARAGQWKKKKGLTGTELEGKTLGLIGLGRIGRAVAARALGLRLEVVASDPFLADGKSPLEGVELLPLEDLLARSDFVSLHVPYSADTHHLLDGRRIASMKRGARLINCARGGLVDEAALLAALERGHLHGAALDVLEVEPPAAGHPLLQRDDVILTPHLGASSDEAQRSVAVEVARVVSEFLSEGVAASAVNAPPLPRGVLRAIAPWVLLCERMGSFLAQRAAAPPSTLEVALSGEILAAGPEHLHRALLVGVLRHGSGSPVNFVSAAKLAADRGLALVAREGEPSPWVHGLVHVRAHAREGAETQDVAGTVLGREGRLVRVDGVALDLPLEGWVLITRHDDQPGVVGLLGTLLGKLAVNIRRIELGPPDRAAGGLAAGFLSLYGQPPADLLERVRALPPVRGAQLVRF